LDYDNKFRFIIERVFERGDVEDIRPCRNYYGDEKVTEVLLEAKYVLCAKVLQPLSLVGGTALSLLGIRYAIPDPHAYITGLNRYGIPMA